MHRWTTTPSLGWCSWLLLLAAVFPLIMMLLPPANKSPLYWYLSLCSSPSPQFHLYGIITHWFQLWIGSLKRAFITIHSLKLLSFVTSTQIQHHFISCHCSRPSCDALSAFMISVLWVMTKGESSKQLIGFY